MIVAQGSGITTEVTVLCSEAPMNLTLSTFTPQTSLGTGGSSSGPLNPQEVVSVDTNNKLELGSDGKLFVQDAYTTDLLALYILSKS